MQEEQQFLFEDDFFGFTEEAEQDETQPKEIRDWAAECVKAVVLIQSSTGEALTKPCGTRRADKCPSCAERYASILTQVNKAGLPDPENGKKGMVLMLTLTQPSFGQVHRCDWNHKSTKTLFAKRGIKANWQLTAEQLEDTHPQAAAVLRAEQYLAWKKSGKDNFIIQGVNDDAVGSPINPATYDYQNQVLFNRMSPVMIANVRKWLRRQLKPYTEMGYELRIKAFAEFQKRGALHFHILIVLAYSDESELHHRVNRGPGGRHKVVGEAYDMLLDGDDDFYAPEFYLKKDKRGWLWQYNYLPDATFTLTAVKELLESAWAKHSPETAVSDEIRSGIQSLTPIMRTYLKSPAIADTDIPSVVKWGKETDIQCISAQRLDEDGNKTDFSPAESVAAYVSKYVVKAAGTSVGDIASLSKNSPYRKHLVKLREEALAQTAHAAFKASVDTMLDSLNEQIAELTEVISHRNTLSTSELTQVLSNTRRLIAKLENQQEDYTDLVDELEQDADDARYILTHEQTMDVAEEKLELVRLFRDVLEAMTFYSHLLPESLREAAYRGKFARDDFSTEFIEEDIHATAALLEQEGFTFHGVWDWVDAMKRLGERVRVSEILTGTTGASAQGEYQQFVADLYSNLIERAFRRVMRFQDYAGHSGSVVYSSKWGTTMKDIREQRLEWMKNLLGDAWKEVPEDETFVMDFCAMRRLRNERSRNETGEVSPRALQAV